MDNKEGKRLVEKAVSIILSCENMDQLRVAINYANLVHRRLSKTLGLMNKTNASTLIERSIGFAQCKIKSNKQPNNQ